MMGRAVDWAVHTEAVVLLNTNAVAFAELDQHVSWFFPD